MKDVITNDVTLAVCKAGISDETRELLEVKAMLYDTAQSLHYWIEKYYSAGDNICDDIYNKSSELHDIIDRYLIQSITGNMTLDNFNNI